jgi:hypothetical protein
VSILGFGPFQSSKLVARPTFLNFFEKLDDLLEFK